MVLVFSSKVTNRIRYIFNLIINDIIGAGPIEFTTDQQKFINYPGPKISYNSQPVSNELFFLSKTLLFDNDIKDY